MKLLTIAVPCYNSEAYMEHCVDSLLPGGDEVEILLINDGSKDRTPEIADRLAEQYPDIVSVVHKENGGHGSGVNVGIERARGLYYKVVDSDDWVDAGAYEKILDALREFAELAEKPDAVISNYVYEKEGARHKKVMRYTKSLPQEKIFTWEDVKGMGLGHYILMHSLIYRTQVLRDCGLHLPEHTFYVDNLFAFVPFPYVKRMYYLNVDFYRYYIGRSDQSVNEKVMISRADQQIRVNKLMIDCMAAQSTEHTNLRRYMLNYLSIVTTVTSIILIRSNTEEALKQKDELWRYMKKKDPVTYVRLRRGLLGIAMNFRSRLGLSIAVTGYKIAQKLYGFN
ncbi:MAG TPA: glycosyl transferase [Lachnospiraceae bacterium]|nr:glycosyl transferase [Lachnospiraceae bacterium]